jgi:hypothetical protein
MTAELIERLCPVKLNDEEVIDRGAKMAEEELQIDELKLERKALNAKIAEHVAERSKLAHVIESRTESRTVRCHWEVNTKAELVILLRDDTREELESRPLTAADRQLALPEMETEKKAKRSRTKKQPQS